MIFDRRSSNLCIYIRWFAEPETVEAGETAYAAATTEPGLGLGEGAGAGGSDGPLEVTVRLLDDGALVRWRRAPGDASRCTVRWHEGPAPGIRLLAAVHTHHDYVLGERPTAYHTPHSAHRTPHTAPHCRRRTQTLSFIRPC